MFICEAAPPLFFFFLGICDYFHRVGSTLVRLGVGEVGIPQVPLPSIGNLFQLCFWEKSLSPFHKVAFDMKAIPRQFQARSSCWEAASVFVSLAHLG